MSINVSDNWVRNMGKISVCFKYHMVIGVSGPLLIPYHASFGLGSIDSNVALDALALVVWSGLVGRYIYNKITCSGSYRSSSFALNEI